MKSRRKQKSCNFCRKRKIKCNRGDQQPCENCIKYGSNSCVISESAAASSYSDGNQFLPRINSSNIDQDDYSYKNHSTHHNNTNNLSLKDNSVFEEEDSRDKLIHSLQDEVRDMKQKLSQVSNKLDSVYYGHEIKLKPIFNTHSIYHFFSTHCLNFMKKILTDNMINHTDTTEYSNLKNNFKKFESLMPIMQKQRSEKILIPSKHNIDMKSLNKEVFYRHLQNISRVVDDNWLVSLYLSGPCLFEVSHSSDNYDSHLIFEESIGFYSYWCIRILEKKYDSKVNSEVFENWYHYMESKIYDKFIEITTGELAYTTVKSSNDIMMFILFLVTKSEHTFTSQLFKFLNIFYSFIKDLGYYDYSRFCVLNSFERDIVYKILILIDYIMVDASFKLGKPLIDKCISNSIFESEEGKNYLRTYDEMHKIYSYTVVKKECYLKMFANNVKFENVDQLIYSLKFLNKKLDTFNVIMKDVIHAKGDLNTAQILGIDSITMKILINRLPIQICMAFHLKVLLYNNELMSNFKSTLEYSRMILNMYNSEHNLFSFPLMVGSLHICISMMQNVKKGTPIYNFFDDLNKMDFIFVNVIKNNQLQKEFLQKIIFLMYSIIECNNVLYPNYINHFTNNFRNLVTYQKYESYNFNLDLESIFDKSSSFFNPILEYDNFVNVLIDSNDERW